MTQDQHLEIAQLIDALIEIDPFDAMRSIAAGPYGKTFPRYAISMESLRAAREHHKQQADGRNV